MPPDTGNVRLSSAGSTGRRNTGVKSLCWGFKLQGLAWPFVELTSHFVQIGLRVHRQVGALWKVLSQQAIGVLVRPALPWALRIAEIDVDFGRQRKAAMIRKFLAPIPSQGLIQLRIRSPVLSYGLSVVCVAAAPQMPGPKRSHCSTRH